MGQAKNRKAEIAALKAQPKQLIKVFAQRNGKFGVIEFVSFGFIPEAGLNNKTALLSKIATSVWGHSAPTDLIADYLVQTNSYAMMSKMQKPVGYFIEFFEDDKDRPGMYSCRTVMGIRTEEQFDAFAKQKMAELSSELDIRTY